MKDNVKRTFASVTILAETRNKRVDDWTNRIGRPGTQGRGGEGLAHKAVCLDTWVQRERVYASLVVCYHLIAPDMVLPGSRSRRASHLSNHALECGGNPEVTQTIGLGTKPIRICFWSLLGTRNVGAVRPVLKDERGAALFSDSFTTRYW